MSTETMTEVTLHSTEPGAVAAARRTIEALPGGALVEKDGRYYVPRGFVAWAVLQQGYVRSAMLDIVATHPGGLITGCLDDKEPT